jgi:peptide/nickel transport system permease protein/oligopeptide transport system permease protein
MLSYILQRSAHMLLVVVGVFVVVFMMVHLLPGDPVQIIFSDAPVPPEQLELVRRQLGLDLPLPLQFYDYVRRAITGDLGRSIMSNRSVGDDLVRVFPRTIALATGATCVAVVGGILFGVISAVLRNTWGDLGLTTFALLGVSFPVFWTGLLLIWVFSVQLGWVPITGRVGVRHLILPTLTLGWYAAGILTRLTRSGMLEVLGQDYVTTARAKGLATHVVLLRHALRNALIPVITVASLQFGSLLGGAVIVETVFALDGLGRYLVTGILQKDFPVVQGAVLIVALVYTLVNFLADISYGILDPRIRYG